MDAWQKGESGNPFGDKLRYAPKIRDLRTIYQQNVEEVYNILLGIVRDTEVQPHVRGVIGKFILEQATGKARQSIEFKVEESIAPNMMTSEQLNLAAAKKTKELVFSLIESGNQEEIDEIEEYIRAKRKCSVINDTDVIEGSVKLLE
jgi:hypothetical protein